MQLDIGQTVFSDISGHIAVATMHGHVIFELFAGGAVAQDAGKRVLHAFGVIILAMAPRVVEALQLVALQLIGESLPLGSKIDAATSRVGPSPARSKHCAAVLWEQGHCEFARVEVVNWLARVDQLEATSLPSIDIMCAQLTSQLEDGVVHVGRDQVDSPEFVLQRRRSGHPTERRPDGLPILQAHEDSNVDVRPIVCLAIGSTKLLHIAIAEEAPKAHAQRTLTELRPQAARREERCNRRQQLFLSLPDLIAGLAAHAHTRIQKRWLASGRLRLVNESLMLVMRNDVVSARPIVGEQLADARVARLRQ